jgi:4-hydroxy-3-methylbut-2-enyl diphosphate reductase
MIHNPAVNADLQAMGIQFIMDTKGNQFVTWDELSPQDIILIPAFGTTLEIERILLEKGIEIRKYDTTCPFVTKVWKQSEKLGSNEYTVIIHGKPMHEETRATFSHSSSNANSIVIKNIDEAIELGKYIKGEKDISLFEAEFGIRCSNGFNPETHLLKVGVVNQTTMLASETQEIADYFKQLMLDKYGKEDLRSHFADTRDTLCYATNDNQQATYGLLKVDADLAIVVGGYNSSNTSHLVELCEEKLPTYFISGAEEILNQDLIHHFGYQKKQMLETENFLPKKNPLRIILTSGASCPDAVVDGVLDKLLEYYPNSISKEEVLKSLD